MSLNSGETLQPFKPLNQLIYDSAGNLIGIQNDRAVGNDLRIGGGSGVDGTFATLIATTALKLNSGATFDLYNTADQTTNYERLTGRWDSNVAKLMTQFGGSAASRFLQIGCASGAGSNTVSTYLQLQAASSASVAIGLIAGSWTGASTMRAAATLAASSGTQTVFAVDPTINQSGTAGYTVLDINPTETATGSGTKLLQRWAVGGTSQALLTSSGAFAANINNAVTYLGIASSLVTSADVQLARDAADTLALRRSTNAQTFRVYNTYTDASNYERGIAGWLSNTFAIGTFNAGTGSNRPIGFYTNNAARWVINVNGHFLANDDNTYDIGASGANRPRNVYVASAVQIAAGNGGLAVGVSATSSTSLGLVASTTARSHINLAAGVAPSSPNNGDIWFDGTDLKIRAGGVTYTFTKT